jgi:DNA-binding HxlR family transcriptional regulator
MPAAPYRLERPRLQYPPDAERSTVPLLACPVKSSMGVLSRKWTLMVVRDVAYYKLSRFHEFLKNNPGLTDRVLARRLKEMVDEGMLERRERDGDVTYHLTSKGDDVKSILLAFLAYGIKHHAGRVFADGQPRSMAETFPQFTTPYVGRMLGTTP